MDLDLDELLATRKLHGLDKINDNDIYIDNIEEDIKNIEEIINLINEELDKKDKNVSAILDLEDLLSLRNLIKAYKKLEEENRIFALEGSRVRLKIHIDKNYIPVSLVEEKIEELNKLLEEDLQDERKINSNRFIIIWQCKSCLQELLEKRK